MPSSRNHAHGLVTKLILLLIIASAAVTAHMLYELQHYVERAAYRFDLGALSGFTDRYSYRPGEQIELYVHTTDAADGILYRYGKTLRDTGRSFKISRTLQSDLYDQIEGFAWEPTSVIETVSLEPGFYGLHLEQQGSPSERFIIPFIIKPETPSEISVILSTNTWDAYNSFGGISNYENNQFSWLTRRLVKVHSEMAGKGNFHQVYLPRMRPNSLISGDLMDQIDPAADYHSHFVRNEWSLIAFLEENNYDYAVFADSDLGSGEALSDNGLLILAGHSEYWTAEMFNAFDRFVDSGGKVLLASGKPMAELVERQSYGLFVRQKQMSEQEIASRVGTTFSQSGSHTASPFRLERDGIWAFEGTALRNGDLFGSTSANLPTPPDQTAGVPQKTGASGLFTAKIGPGSHRFTRLAQGANADGAADMVYKDTPSGGWIFNASSETFFGCTHRDDKVARLVLNLVEDALSDPQ